MNKHPVPPVQHICPNCGKEVLYPRRLCPFCGWDIQGLVRPTPNATPLILFLAATPLVYCGSCFLLPATSGHFGMYAGPVVMLTVTAAYVGLVIFVWVRKNYWRR